MSYIGAISFPHAAFLNASSSAHDRPGEPRGALRLLFLLFLLSCVFDPADKVLSLKVWLFLACWAITVLAYMLGRTQLSVPRGLLIYILLFMLVPLFSIVVYWLTNGSSRFEGFSMMKGYVLITLALLLVLNRINLLPLLCAVLTVLALAVIGVFIAVLMVPALQTALYFLGQGLGVLYVAKRDYGSGVVLLQIYFATSPMLAISIAYFFNRARSARSGGAAALYWTLCAINIAGMLLAGSRNNILISLVLPVVLWFLYARNKGIAALLCGGLVALAAVIFANQLGAFFDPAEASNDAKIGLLRDYARILSDPLVLIFGQGLGAYDQWQRGNLFATEFTYFDLVRNFGLFGAIIMLCLLLLPIAHAFRANRPRGDRAIAVGFALYLVMCASNPNLFSSMGILILSVMIANVFRAGRPMAASTTGSRAPVGQNT